MSLSLKTTVALRKESVDRNFWCDMLVLMVAVALRKESVDRNLISLAVSVYFAESLSARRAWIEIKYKSDLSLAEASRSPQGERG